VGILGFVFVFEKSRLGERIVLAEALVIKLRASWAASSAIRVESVRM
jgi:hypothetical protein